MVWLTVLMVVVLPLTGLLATLLLMGRVQRAREVRIARQVGVTDAIHRELGAVVAPVVKRRGAGRSWRVEIAVPFESPLIVGRVGAIAHTAMLGFGGGEPCEVVLTAQERPIRGIDVRTRALAGPSPLAAGEREVIAWTGNTMSRAS
jgi:hypothetical protein